MLLSINAGMGLLLSCPELAWNEKDAASVADAFKDVQQHYDKVIDPKTLAWLNLIGTIGWIEGSKILAIRMRLKNEKKKLAPPPPAQPPTPDVRVFKPNGAPVPGVGVEPQRKPSEDPMVYTLNPIKE